MPVLRGVWTWLLPPHGGDRRQLEAGRTLHTILLGGLCVALSFGLSAPFLFETPWLSVLAYFAMAAAHVLAIDQVKRGRARAVAIAMTLFMFVFITLKAARFGGLRGIGIFVYPTVVILAALTWSVRAAVGVAIAASLSAAGMELWDPMGWNETFARPTPLRAWVSLTGVMAIVTVMVSVGLRSMRAAELRERQLRDQLQQAQKHEALGRLAAGVAHDFNNMLMVISGSVGLLKQDASTRDAVAQIQQATGHAAELTKQLLEFGRRQRSEAQHVSMQAAMDGTQKLLRSLLPERIAVRVDPSMDAALIDMDAASFERVVVNLATNARDAMPDGGSLTITLDRQQVRERSMPDVLPGHYARLTVSDTGVGMDAATQAQIFEPYYTTKTQGRGNGLGLASVHGIVIQHRGHIRCESAPGQGTRFELLLPLVERTVDSDPPVLFTPPHASA